MESSVTSVRSVFTIGRSYRDMSDYMENGIPFRMTLPKEPYRAEKGYRAMFELSEESEKNGLVELKSVE